MAETREDVYHACTTFQKRVEAKYPQVIDCLVKDTCNAGVLGLPSRALSSYLDDEPDSIHVRHRSLMYEQGEVMWQQKDDVNDGLQVNVQCSNEVVSSKRF